MYWRSRESILKWQDAGAMDTEDGDENFVAALDSETVIIGTAKQNCVIRSANTASRPSCLMLSIWLA